MVAKAQDTRFQNLTIDYQQLMRLSPAKRSSLLDSVDGRSLLSSLTAEQLQAAFPYDKSINSDKLKNVMTGEGTKAQSGDSSGVDAKVKDKVTGRNSKTDPKAEAQLSKEQQEILKKLKNGQISAGDPKAAFLKKISDTDLEKSGIKAIRNEKGEIQSYGRSEIAVSQDDIEAARKSGVSGKDNKEIVMKAFADELRKKGVSPENLPFAVSALSGQVQAESKFNPSVEHDKGTGYGIYGARDPNPGRGRKTDMFNWLKQNGYDKDSAEGQARYMVNEAFGGKYPQTANALRNANKDNLSGVTSVLVDEFEAPAERRQNKIDRLGHTQRFLPEAQASTLGVNIGSNASDDQIKEQIINRKRGEQDRYLTGLVGTTSTPGGRQTAGSQTGGAISDNLKLSGGAAERGHDESLGKMNPELRARLAAAIADLPEGMRENVKIGSGYRDPNDPRIQELYRQHQRSGSTRPMANPHNSQHGHNEGEGGAADIEGLPKDPQSLKIIRETFDKHGLHAPVRGEGFGDGGMPHVQMKPGATESRQYAQEQQQQSQPQQQAQTAPGPRNAVIAMGSNDFSDPKNVYANTIEQIRKAKEAGLNPVIIAPNPNGKTGAAHAEVARAAQDAGAKLEIPQAWSRDGVHPSSGEYNRLGTQYKGSTFSGDSIAVGIGQQSGLKTQRDENNRTYLLDENGQRTARVGAPTSEIASRYGNFPQQQQAQPQQQAQAEEEPSPIIRNFPDGGEMQTGADQLQVYALDKNKLQRDDSIALDGDGKPQFTMNSKESMKFDPNTGRVEVDNGSKGYRNDPNQLGPEPKEQPQQSEKKQEQQKSADESKTVDAQMREVPRPMPTSNDTGHNSMYETVNLTDNIFKTPSFQRAIARSRFQNSGDSALGGHFDGGQAAYGVV